LVDAGDSAQQFHGEAKGLDLSVDLLIDVADRVVDGVESVADASATENGDAG